MENINELSIIDRPREKILLHGAAALSDIELLAILLSFGGKDMPVVTLCTNVLANYDNNLERLGETTLDQLCRIKGIGTAKGAIILAAMELGRRWLALQHQTPKVKTDADATRIVRPYFNGVQEQRFILVLLNRNYELLAFSELSLNDGLPEVSQLLQLVIVAGAYGFGIVRNQINTNEEFLAAETKILADLAAAAQMLRLKYFGRVLIE